MNVLQQISTLFQYSITPGQFIRNITIALICGFLISRFYCWSTNTSNNAKTFIGSLITLTMITAIVILVIGNNLARAFGLVGAMSIIRFRTAVKDVQDIVFIFFSLAIGMAAGIGLSMIALTGTIAVGIVTVMIAQIQSISTGRQEYLLQFNYSPTDSMESPYLPVIKKFCRKYHIINMKSCDYSGQLELSFYIKLKNQDTRENFIRELKGVESVGNINLLFD